MHDKARFAAMSGGVQELAATTAKALGQCGYKAVASRQHANEMADALSAEAGFPVAGLDVSDFTACEEHLSSIETEHGPIDVLVNHAGVDCDGAFQKMSREVSGVITRAALFVNGGLYMQREIAQEQRGFREHDQ